MAKTKTPQQATPTTQTTPKPQSTPKTSGNPGQGTGAPPGGTSPGEGAGSAAGGAAPDSSALNQQIVQAVELTKSSVLDVAQQEGQSVAYQKVTQATAFAIQDATDYLRNVETISTAAQGVALTKLIEEKDPFYLTVLTAAQAAVVAAQTNFTAVGTAATTVTTSYPSGS
ncbi:hypothetical protein ACTL6U_13430 [Rhodovibrionaceae bacterium A322]